MPGFTEGLDATIGKLKQLGTKIDAAALRGAYTGMELLIPDMIVRTPIDTGNLRATLHVVGPRHTPEGIEGAWSAGGPAEPYAERQHEDESLHHPVAGTGAKFISAVVDAREQDVVNAIDRELSEVIAKADIA